MVYSSNILFRDWNTEPQFIDLAALEMAAFGYVHFDSIIWIYSVSFKEMMLDIGIHTLRELNERKDIYSRPMFNMVSDSNEKARTIAFIS